MESRTPVGSQTKRRGLAQNAARRVGNGAHPLKLCWTIRAPNGHSIIIYATIYHHLK